MTCPECHKGELRVSFEPHHYLESGLPNVVLANAEIDRCPRCGMKFVTIWGMAKLHRAIALALIDKPGRLTPSEIRYLRKSLGWSGSDFARQFHTDRATVSRWESETTPQSMATQNELLLRLAIALGECATGYDVNRLADLAKGERTPARLRLRATKKGWRAELEAA